MFHEGATALRSGSHILEVLPPVLDVIARRGLRADSASAVLGRV
jgi:hypothetical protein